MDLNILIIPTVFIGDPGLGAAKLEIPVRQLTAQLLHPGCNLVFDVIRAVHQQISTSTGAKQLAA